LLIPYGINFKGDTISGKNGAEISNNHSGEKLDNEGSLFEAQG